MPPRPTFREAPEPKEYIELPPIPEASSSSDTHWVCGWPFSYSHLANQVRRQLRLNRHGYSVYMEAEYVIQALRERSGFSHVGIFQCKPRPVDMDGENGCLALMDDGSDCISVLGFTCNHEDYIRIRPSLRQMTVWQAALGTPSWIETLHPRNDFPFEVFEN
ncbi:hypothetical protein BKA70DRAFT_1522401 [Coprinopsis sp. MPI-PUGE-AT-0042]|nr:hypothetical protein BKA70DRAFT_1522401 [Coprinopsis sp. MPI-PUGE-AT-0042]